MWCCDAKIGVIGLGYVGLPLALEFGKRYQTVGFDISRSRIKELNSGVDNTLECSQEEISSAHFLFFTDAIEALAECNVYVVTVPTPVDEYKKPDLSPLVRATEMLGELIKLGDIVIYESTVYPGATEEECIPILEKISGLKFNEDFFVGYSPERVNPGDKKHRLTMIKKVTSGSTPDAAQKIDELYSSIIQAGTYRAPSIAVAEAAKVIENTQRDLNIALVNELAVIFNQLGIDTEEVLKAAETKWNFLPFRPGLVGGHCIGVDPYYLTHKAQSIGYSPEVILAGRRINDGMAGYVAARLVKEMLGRKIEITGSRVLVLGVTFKENCPDLRNSKVIDVVKELQSYNIEVTIYDPWVKNGVELGCDACLVEELDESAYNAIVLAVAHDDFKAFSNNTLNSYLKDDGIIYDLKYVLASDEVHIRL